MKSLLLTISAGAFLTGCATNPFAQYYQGYTNQMPASLQRRLLAPSSTPQIVTTSAQRYAEEARRLEEEGYAILGSTSFWGFNPTHEQIREQAKKVGADVAIWASDYSHTEQGVRPIFTYLPGETYTTTHYGSATADVYGTAGHASGYGTYSGTSTTTTPGSIDTGYVPYQRRIYNHGASFWRRTKPAVFGATLGPIPEDLRAILQRNTGAYVKLVMLDGPAFRANIMRGDIVIQLADKPVNSFQELLDVLPSFAGKKVSLKLLRGGQTLDIEVQLNPDL
jgi:hypothetical protein